MSHVRKSRRRTKNKGGNVKVVEGYAGLWISVDDAALDVLLRVRKAYTYPMRSDTAFELIGDIVKAEELEKFEGGEKYTLLEAFPRTIKMHMPNKALYFHVKKMTLGRAKRGDTLIPVVLRGTVSNQSYQVVGGHSWISRDG